MLRRFRSKRRDENDEEEKFNTKRSSTAITTPFDEIRVDGILKNKSANADGGRGRYYYDYDDNVKQSSSSSSARLPPQSQHPLNTTMRGVKIVTPPKVSPPPPSSTDYRQEARV